MDGATVSDQYEEPDQPMQNMNEIMQILAEATIPPQDGGGINQLLSDSLDLDEDYYDVEDLGSDLDLDADSSGEVVHAM